MLQSRKRVVYLVSGLLISGFLATSLASYFVSRASLRAEISQNQLPLTSDNIYSEIQRDLIPAVFIASLMASDTFLRDWVIHGEKNELLIRKYLNEIQTQYNTFTSFFVSERSRIYYHSKGILKKVDPAQERDAWYFRVSGMKTPYEINVDPDMANRDAVTIFINYRVFDYHGSYIGATGVGLTVNAVKKIIDAYRMRYDRSISFVGRSGDVILSSSAPGEGGRNIREMEGLSEVADEILSKESGNFRYSRNGKNCYLNTRFIKEFQWHLMVEQSDEEATRTILNALLANLLLCAIVTAVILVLTNLTISGYQGRLEKMATTDKLTGLHNRQSLDIIFSQAVKEEARTGVPMSVILIDIDHFKEVNDRFGHLAGDQVIRSVGLIVSAQIRQSDVLARWGGDEFLVLMKNCSMDNALLMAGNIRARLKGETVMTGETGISCTLSLGVAQYCAPESLDDLLGRADLALYRAKKKGRDMVESA